MLLVAFTGRYRQNPNNILAVNFKIISLFVAGSFAALFINSGIYFVLIAHSKNTAATEIYADFMQRTVGEGMADSLSPMYRQYSANSSGGSAVAYALTYLGDSVLKEDIAQTASIEDKKYELLDLSRFVGKRGFKLAKVMSGWEGLVHMSNLPTIVSRKNNHYVTAVLTTKDKILYFDPAVGNVIYSGREQFERGWDNVFYTILPKK